VDLGAAVVANEQPLEMVQPGEGALDNPAISGAIRYLPTRPRTGGIRSRSGISWGGEAELERQMPPGDPGVQQEQDPLQRLTPSGWRALPGIRLK